MLVKGLPFVKPVHCIVHFSSLPPSRHLPFHHMFDVCWTFCLTQKKRKERKIKAFNNTFVQTHMHAQKPP